MDPAARESLGKRITDDVIEFARKRSQVLPRYVASLKALANKQQKRRRAQAATRASELRRNTGNKQEVRAKDSREQGVDESGRLETHGKEADDDEPEEACCRRRRRRCAPRRRRRRSSCRRRRRMRRSCGRRRRRSASRRRRRRSCRQRRRRRTRRGCGCS